MLLLLLLACQDDKPDNTVGISDLEIAETASPTVFALSWKSDDEATGRIEYGMDGAFDHTLAATVDETGHHHTLTLAGLAAGQTWSIRTVTVVGGEETVGEPVELDVPAAPDRLDDAVVSDDAPEHGGFFIVCLPTPGDNIVAIIDRQGRPTWWTTDTSDGELLQCKMTEDGSAVEFLIMGYAARFSRVSLTGEVELDRPIGDVHHSFVQVDDGGYYTLKRDIRDVEGTEITGDALVRMNKSFKLQDEVWNAWDALPAPEPGPDSIDWTHANELSMDSAQAKMLVSLHELSTIVQIDLTTGAMDWQLGGDASDFTQTEDGTFHQQHGVRYIDGGLLIFDNGLLQDDIVDSHSRVLELAMDKDAGTTSVVRTYEPEDGIYVPTLGNADMGADGVVTVVWGSGGRINELVPDGDGYDMQYQLDMGLGAPFAYGHRVDSLLGATF